MTLQRRLILWVLVIAPLAWLLTTAATYWQARHEINELYDTDMVRLAQQIHFLLPALNNQPVTLPDLEHPGPEPGQGDQGDAALGDLAVSAWRPDGTSLLGNEDGLVLPYDPKAEGFTTVPLNGEDWRIYYLQDPIHNWHIAIGQRLGERAEMVSTFMLGQAALWLIGLPILLLALLWAVRQALHPVRQLSQAIARRNPDDATPLRAEGTPAELHPLVNAINHLITRVSNALEHERRLTADAAHELRTPLAAMRAQWEVATRATDAHERRAADAKVQAGIGRMERLIAQLLAMARLENKTSPTFTDTVDWHRVIEHAINDSLSLSAEKNIDIDVLWPGKDQLPLPLTGDENLLTLLLRNLVDNAVRYSPANTCVSVHFEPTRIRVVDQGKGVPENMLARLGDRFFRVTGQEQPGSGLGLSIARHIAQLHGLQLHFQNTANGGLVATLERNAVH